MCMPGSSDTRENLSNKRFLSGRLGPRSGKALISAIILTIAIAAATPFFFSRYEQAPGGSLVRRLVTTHDLWMHLHTMEQFDKSLRSGVIYPRWVADINHGYGILTLIYYPPGFFYLTSAAHAIFPDWLNALFVVTALSLAASGFAFYFLARVFYGILASSLAAVFYMIMPIHMLDLYWRGGLPQFAGYIFPPMIIYFAYKLGREGKPRYYAGLGLFYGLHLLTHLPVALMFSYALAFLAIVWSVRELNWRIGARLAAAMAIGLLLSAVYWLPAALEARYAYEFASAIFPYHQSYITLLEPHDVSLFSEFFRVLNNVFVVSTLALIIVLAVLRVLRRSYPNPARTKPQWTPLSMWTVMAIATTFMATSFSIYISKLLPEIQVAVPAWRWLAIAGMFTSLLAAAAIDLLSRRPDSRPIVSWTCGIAFALIVLTNIGFSIDATIVKPLSNPVYHPAASASEVVESSWTPKNATHPQQLPETPMVMAQPASAEVEVSKWDPEDRSVYIKTERLTMLRLKTYNFPGWTARIDGAVVPMLSDEDGIQQVEVPAGTHLVQATFENTRPRTAGALLAGVGLLAIIGLSLTERVRPSRVAAEPPPGSAAGEEEFVSLASHAKHRRAIPLTIGLIATGIIIVVAFVVMTTTKRHSDKQDAQPVVGATHSPGSETHLFLTGQDSITVAIDERALGELLTALASRDSGALDAIVGSGRAVRVPNDTAVRVLEMGTGKVRVRILEGSHTMADGWVPERWLR